MNIIYTANGYIGIIFIILVAIKVIMRQAKKTKNLNKTAYLMESPHFGLGTRN